MSTLEKDSEIEDLLEILLQRLEEGELTLPPLPEVGQQVIALVSDETTSAEDLAGLVQRDAGLASTLIRYSNTAASGGMTRIVSVQQAVSRLGMRRVAELAFMVSLRSGVGDGTQYRDLLDVYWRRSLATALFAKEIARELRGSVEVAFLCGLLRGVGPPLVLHALTELPRDAAPANSAQAAEFGETLGPAFLHAAVRMWELPETIAAAIEPPSNPEERRVEARITSLAERIADHILACEGGETVPEFGADSDAEALNIYPDMLEDLIEMGPTICEELDKL